MIILSNWQDFIIIAISFLFSNSSSSIIYFSIIYFSLFILLFSTLRLSLLSYLPSATSLF